MALGVSQDRLLESISHLMMVKSESPTMLALLELSNTLKIHIVCIELETKNGFTTIFDPH